MMRDFWLDPTTLLILFVAATRLFWRISIAYATGEEI